MQASKFLVLPLVLILLSSGVVPFTFASVESEAQEDIQAGCRDGNVLVYRFTYKDYVCVEPSTADRWEELGMAEIVDASSSEKQTTPQEEKPQLKPQFEDAPPPPKTTTITSDLSECRAGYTLVFRFIHHDTFCTSPSTAASWEKLGLAEIITHTDDVKPEEPQETIEEPEVSERENNIPITKPEPKPVQQAKPISSAGVSLPAYPNQPSVNPKLQASNDFWSPPAVHKVNERIWVAVGYDLANSIMIEGEKGIIIVDTLSTYEKAKKVLGEFRKITDKPVKAIIYTHGHLDHVQGTKAFIEEGDGSVEIIAHDSLLDFYINENSVLGPIASVRSIYATGAMLPEKDINMGLFPKAEPGTIAFVPPTHTFSSELSLDISGVKMQLVHVAGESSDQIYVWLPEDEALLIGDNVYSIFPNIYTLRGAVYRDPMNYVNALDKVIPLEPEHLVPSHVKPVSGKENVLDVLISTRDATQYVYDQTIRGMNNGYTADELSTMITLPEWFDEHPWLSQSRGQIPWHVKQIYYGNLGWFQGDPAFLLPVSPDERAQKIVDGFGGTSNVIKQIRAAIDNKEYSWAAELATYGLENDPDNKELRLLKAYALRVLGQQMLSADARHWALTSASELEGNIVIDPTAFSQTSLEQLAEIPIEKILRALPTKVDPVKLDETNSKLGIYYSDLDLGFTLHFRNGILAVLDGFDESAYHSIVLDSETHKKIILGELTLIDGVESGQIEFDGETSEIQEMLDYFDPFAIYARGVRG